MTDRRRQDIDYVRAILQAGSFLAATEILHLTQPAISQYISKIEKEQGIQLFNRGVRPVSLTSEGRYWLEIEERIEALRERRRSYFRDLQGRCEGRLRIGTNQCRTATLLADVIPRYVKAYPGVRLELVEDSISHLSERFLKGDIDFALTIESAVTPEMDSRVLADESLLVAVPPQHPLAARARRFSEENPGRFMPIDFKEVAGEEFVLLNRGVKMHDYFFDLCRRCGATPRVLMLTESVTSVLELVSKGVCCGIVPDSLVLYKPVFPAPGFFSIQHEVPVNRVVAAWSREL